MASARLLDALCTRVAKALSRYETLASRPRLLVAVSGGTDSTALSLVVAELHRRGSLPAPPILAHVDHRARADSARDADVVARLADALGLPFSRTELPPWPSPPSEAALRDARYAALVAAARDHDAGTVLTAHTADDDLETVLFRMLRGTGPRGLAGVPELRVLAPGVLLVRPLLETRRRTLTRLLEEAGVTPIEDPTNADVRFARNWIRHELVPELRANLGTSLDASMFALKRSARAAVDVVDAQALRHVSKFATHAAPFRIELALPPDRPWPDDGPLRDAVLVEIHRRLAAGIAPLRAWSTRVAALAAQPAGRRVDGGSPVLAERTRDGILFVAVASAGAPPTAPIVLADATETPQHVAFGTTEWTFVWRRHDEPPLSPSPAAAGRRRALIALPNGSPLRLRTRRPGDRFRPLGAGAPIELRRFLQARHVPRFDRDRLPLVVDERDAIVWVPSAEIAQDAALTLATRSCVELRVETTAEFRARTSSGW